MNRVLVIPLIKSPCTNLKRRKFPRRIGLIEETRKEGLSKVLIYVLGVELEVPYVRLLPTTVLAFFRARFILATWSPCTPFVMPRTESRDFRADDREFWLIEITVSRKSRLLSEQCSALERAAMRRRIGRRSGNVCRVSETSRVSAYRFPLEFFSLLLPIPRWGSMKRKRVDTTRFRNVIQIHAFTIS